MMYRPKHQAALSSFSFNSNGYTIKPIKVLKILGFYFRHDLKLDSQVGKICSELHNRIYQLKQISKFMTFKTRLCFIQSLVIGKLLYAFPYTMEWKKIYTVKFIKL